MDMHTYLPPYCLNHPYLYRIYLSTHLSDKHGLISTEIQCGMEEWWRLKPQMSRYTDGQITTLEDRSIGLHKVKAWKILPCHLYEGLPFAIVIVLLSARRLHFLGISMQVINLRLIYFPKVPWICGRRHGAIQFRLWSQAELGLTLSPANVGKLMNATCIIECLPCPWYCTNFLWYDNEQRHYHPRFYGPQRIRWEQTLF